MSSAVRSAAAIAVTLLAAGIVAVVVLSTVVPPIGAGPGTSATPAASAEPTASQRPTASPTDAPTELEAIAQIEAQVRGLRGLAAPQIGPPDVITRSELGDELDAILDAEWTPDELRRANLVLQALGLLDPDQDLRELTAQLLSGQVLGFYDPPQKRMVVVSDTGLTPEARITYAHEYTHALQDGAFGIFDVVDRLTDDDEVAALQALTEGDATVVMFQWAFGNLTPDELAQVGATPLPDMTGIPGWMVRQLEWSYWAGYTFVTSLASGGDWAAVDAAYADPPVSSEQVIHPDKYAVRELPVAVPAPQVAPVLGAGWEELEPDTLGEAMIDIWLAELGASAATDVAAAGWGGDRLTVAAGPDGEWAMAWRIAWDSVADAQEFADAWLGLAPAGGTSMRLVRPAGDETLVLRGSSAAIVSTLAAGLGS